MSGTPAYLDLITPRPIEEYHEDMGDVLWWHWKWFEGSKRFDWANEAPYVGSPLDVGFTVEAHTTTRLITQTNQEHDPEPTIHRIHAGGWPGYHTHFTPLPMVQHPPHVPRSKEG